MPTRKAGAKRVAMPFVVLLAVLTAPATRAQPPQPLVNIPQDWSLLDAYSDEFDGDVLDSSKWKDYLQPWGLWTWDRSLVNVNDGRLLLTMEYAPHERNGDPLSYRAGIVQSRAEALRYGYFEARIRATPRWPGVATAFWLFRNTPEYWTEIDIVEMMQRRSTREIIDHSLYVTRGADVPDLPVRDKREARVRWDPSADFHVFSSLWTENEVLFFADGALLSRVRNTYWHHPMDITLSLGLRAPLNAVAEREGFPTTAEIDYVRVWGAKTN